MSPMKRERELEALTMENYSMLLCRGGELIPRGRVFECKTCNRKFPSFQALGGHRASHRKPQLPPEGSGSETSQGSPSKPKTHECTICGLEFGIGQALGGHMRRHKANSDKHTRLPIWSQSSAEVPFVMKKSSNGGGRVLCLDLNLTPSENDDLQLGYDCF